MPATCVIGLQWGDEAKGKIVDLLTPQHDVVVRYQGGANAGHTVVHGSQTYKLSLVPSGIFRPQVQCVVAAGVVINPERLLAEIDALGKQGIQVAQNLLVSDRAHVIFPWHVEEDRLLNEVPGGEAIGTTLRGIGPCYCDKLGRSHALRVGDMYRADFRSRIDGIVRLKRRVLAALSGAAAAPAPVAELDPAAIFDQYSRMAERLRPYVGDTTAYLLEAAEAGKRILLEGAQGAMLDIDHGTFPFVTSSNSSGVGVCAGSGLPPRHIHKVIGVLKAYSTRVGGGPFVTEQDNPTGNHIRERGREYGTVTRRPRRCGWFDAVAARYAARLSGADALAVMLLDVLGELAELKICVAYDLDGQRLARFPANAEDLRRVQPVYETLPGWQAEITHARTMSELPQRARDYLDRLSELLSRPVEIVSVGPDREQTIRA